MVNGKVPGLVRNGMAFGIDSGLVVVATVAMAVVGWESEVIAIAVVTVVVVVVATLSQEGHIVRVVAGRFE